MTALDVIRRRSLLVEGFVAPRSGDIAIAVAGLERMRRLVNALGNPQHAYTTIHVAGSKGKGSTVAYAAAILTATGRRTGRYTSPHLMDWRERIAVDGTDISEADFDRVVAYVDETMSRLEAERPHDPPHNAFELLTAAAFVHFAEVMCDAAVIEVGIGGRFDSTNVIDADVAVITSIEAEHLDILGPTLADVAWNKAGILRPGQPCVTVSHQPAVAGVVRGEAAATGAALLEQGRDWDVDGDARRFDVDTPRRSIAHLTISNRRPDDLSNAAAAIVAVDLVSSETLPTPPEIQTGLALGSLPGRFEAFEVAPLVVLDVAHTARSLGGVGDGVRVAFGGRRVVALLGILDDKDVAGIAAAVAGWADAVVATTPPSPRALPSSAVATAVGGCDVDVDVEDVPSPDDAWDVARRVTGPDGVLLVIGSFALVGHFRRLLVTAQATR